MPVLLPLNDHSRHPAFGAAGLDRLSEDRGDAEKMAGLRARADASAILFAGGHVVFDPARPTHPCRSFADLAPFGARSDDLILLGTLPGSGAPVYACETAETTEHLVGVGQFVQDVRGLAVAGEVEPQLLTAIAQGAAALNWHRTHGFCARCGVASRMAQMGWRRDCPSCGTQHFPRTDPVVIMLAIDGDRCLLGRQAHFPPGMYSCLAGFVEPGETLEDATRREILEESGIRTGRVGYFASQPWPFPMSLMIGMHAEALTTEIHLTDAELEDCRWFSRAECRQLLDGTHPDGLVSPKPLAIAHHILRAFIDG